MTDTQLALGMVAVLLPSVMLHEVAHGWVADLLGDDTARRAGRISLNPVRHVDPFGTIVLPVMLALTAPFVIGYAKPVPVIPSRLRHPRRDSLLVALAGPATNLALGGLGILVFRVFRPEEGSAWWFVFALVTVVNIALGLFNLLPIPPLDGSAIIEFALPERARPIWYRMRLYMFPVLFLVLVLFRDLLDPIFQSAIDLWRAQQ
jgi:Zn-dependent protease